MVNLHTRFFGLDLVSPIIIGSSGLSNSIEKIKLLEENGAGAVVLKSVFEEEIYNEYQAEFKNQIIGHHNLEYLDYFDYEIKDEKIKNYLELIKGAKAAGVKIPLVASLNCTSGNDWLFFAQKLEEAGADALELNLFLLPSDLDRSSEEVHYYYFTTVRRVVQKANIPVTIKISPFFSDLAGTVKELSEAGLKGITMFNRSFNIDIDVNNRELVPAMILSHPFEYLQSLRWIGIMSGRVACDLAASTGVHNAETALKMLMAGASSVQIVSTVYKNGYEAIREIKNGIVSWMEQNNFENLSDLIGIANKINVKNPAWYERVQFMKYFGGYDVAE
jgi:dihydroorotate dehydrogenase (fumarate)